MLPNALQHLRQRVTDLDRQGQQPAHCLLQHHHGIGNLAGRMPVGLDQLRPLEMEQQRHGRFRQVRLPQRFQQGREQQSPLLLGVDVSLQRQLVAPFRMMDVVIVDAPKEIVEQFDEAAPHRRPRPRAVRPARWPAAFCPVGPSSLPATAGRQQL